jgi:hypothetical protein
MHEPMQRMISADEKESMGMCPTMIGMKMNEG